MQAVYLRATPVGIHVKCMPPSALPVYTHSCTYSDQGGNSIHRKTHTADL